jgi:predicted small lipoprotein YifL
MPQEPTPPNSSPVPDVFVPIGPARSLLVTSPLSSRLFAAVLLGMIAASLASCGRKGPLEPDPSAPASAPASDQKSPDGAALKPKRSFLLDPML